MSFLGSFGKFLGSGPSPIYYIGVYNGVSLIGLWGPGVLVTYKVLLYYIKGCE